MLLMWWQDWTSCLRYGMCSSGCMVNTAVEAAMNVSMPYLNHGSARLRASTLIYDVL